MVNYDNGWLSGRYFVVRRFAHMIEKWPTVLPRLTGKEPRTVYVYVPDDFQDDPDARYPVLYMFDGHNVFFDEDATYGKSWGMKEFMEQSGTPLIIVAVDCNHSPDHGRLKEYSPFSFTDPSLGAITGKGRKYMNWMVDSLKPLIDSHYPTLPQRETTFVAGSSMGGLMSLYAVMRYNHVFSRAACLSPSIWLAVRKLDRMIREADVAPDTVIYMDYGSREMTHHANMRGQFTRVTAALLEKQVLLTSRVVPNGDHCEACWEEQIPFFINTLLYQRD